LKAVNGKMLENQFEIETIIDCDKKMISVSRKVRK
jgi:hypothetical protein